MSELDEIRDSFFLECEELLESVADRLAGLGGEPHERSEAVNAVFRAVHSIKGGAAAFDLRAVTAFAHGLETALDRVRREGAALGPAAIALFERAADHLADLLEASRLQPALADPAGAELLERVEAARPQQTAVGPDADAAWRDAPGMDEAFAPVALSADLLPAPPGAEAASGLEITLRPTRALFESGHDPVHLFRELETLGRLDVTAERAAKAAPGDPGICWRLRLHGPVAEAEVAELFEFVAPLADLAIQPLDAPPTSGAVASGAARQASDPPAPAVTAAAPPEAPPPDRPVAPGPDPEAARPTIRVDLAQLDELSDALGELIVNRSALHDALHRAGLAAASEIGVVLDDYGRLTERLQDRFMALRAQPVKPLFRRMARVAREAADRAGKAVGVQIEGAETRIDRTMIERLVDPLTHLLRNAVDHGIEPAGQRRARGKPAAGAIRLSAACRSGRVVIEIADDGGGIDRARVLDLARERGLAAPEARLSDPEIDALLFAPGFTTRPDITDLSGRGVGLDVVHRAIRALGGRVSVASTPGAGTCFSIDLPLTLAVLDGLIVEAARQRLVVPTGAVLETVTVSEGSAVSVAPDRRAIRFRDALAPVIDLRAAFGARVGDWVGRAPPPETQTADRARIHVVVEAEPGGLCALAVDRVIDRQQVVIKSLAGPCGPVPGVAAATILGDGGVALILDAAELQRFGSPPGRAAAGAATGGAGR
ncbi:chemotaxis protein CheA [Roseivivax sp. CAU 1761]